MISQVKDHFVQRKWSKCQMYVHTNVQEATLYIKKITREEALLFDPPL